MTIKIVMEGSQTLCLEPYSMSAGGSPAHHTPSESVIDYENLHLSLLDRQQTFARCIYP
jgi:hypothetical protein